MRLLTLDANKSTFHTLNFNKKGLSLIVGTKSDKGNTYNGVGKSLIIELLHFCLGSDPSEEFATKIPDWIFYLEFEIAGTRHRAERSTAEQKIVVLDGEELSLQNYTIWLQERTFFIPNDVAKLSFRSLLPRFLRRNAIDYTAPLKFTADFSDYDRLVRNAFLLGVDIHLIDTKYKLKKTYDKLINRKKFFKNDPFLKDFYPGGKDVNIQLRHLEDKIKKLDIDVKNFVVAENYYEMQEDADAIAREIQSIKNTIFIVNSSISNIDKSLNITPDIPLDRIKKVYAEMISVFKDTALKRIDDVVNFHSSLIEKRKHRLIKDRSELFEKRNMVLYNLKEKQKHLDVLLSTLGNSGALDQYIAIVNQISELRSQAQKLRDYRELQTQLSNETAECEKKFTDELVLTNTYLQDSNEELNKIFSIFERLADEFYPDAPAGVSILNNEGQNQVRFDLDVRIENDTSDGINEVRIFCYDMMILSARQNHEMHFLMHDSRLYANVDVRQRAKMFDIAYEMALECDFQYIATLNPDMVESMREQFDEKMFAELFENSTIEELTDIPDNSGKLLGIQVDLQYTKE